MKITTGGTGMVSSQSSMTASVLQQAIAALNYNYTWAWDASKQEDVDANGNYGFDNNPTTSYLATLTKIENSGIRWQQTKIGTARELFTIVESKYSTTAHSYGATASVIPDGTFPPVADITGTQVNTINPAAENHPGRYFSVLATYNETPTFTGTPAPNIHPNILLYGQTSTSQFRFLWYSGLSSINGRVKYLDGVEVTTDISQATISSIVGTPTFFTWDQYGPNYYNYNDDQEDDPYKISFGPMDNIDGQTVDLTLHGFVFSDEAPSNASLPLHITSPTLGSGPA